MNAITDRIVVGDIRDAAAHDRLAAHEVSVVAAALAVRENLPLPDAFAAVADERPVAQPHEALIRQAERYLDA